MPLGLIKAFQFLPFLILKFLWKQFFDF
jgi:hypothetical protein